MSTPTTPSTAEISLTVSTADGNRVLTAALNGSTTARDLLAQLPLRLRFRDFNGVEKLARLPHALVVKGMPAGAAPEPGGIGFYAPTGALVLYYRDVGHWPGIALIGRLSEEAVQVLIGQQEDFDAVVAAPDDDERDG